MYIAVKDSHSGQFFCSSHVRGDHITSTHMYAHDTFILCFIAPDVCYFVVHKIVVDTACYIHNMNHEKVIGILLCVFVCSCGCMCVLMASLLNCWRSRFQKETAQLELVRN